MNDDWREIDEQVRGETVATRFLATAAATPHAVAVRDRQPDGSWHERTFAQLADDVARTAQGLRDLGVDRGDRVLLMLRNRPEFHVLDLATLFLGATPVSIYNSSSPQQVAHVANNSGARVCAVEHGLLAVVDVARSDAPALQTCVSVGDGSKESAGDDTFAALVGSDGLDLEAAAKTASPDDLATVIYTSGTTGPPKGVMLPHEKIVWFGEAFARFGRRELGLTFPHPYRVVSYLPMAHVLERWLSHYTLAFYGWQTSCCPDLADLASMLTDVRPEILGGPPRVFEKLRAGVYAALSDDPERRAQLDDAIATSLPIALRRAAGTASAEDEATWQFLDEVAFSGLRGKLGLDALALAGSGAAAVPRALIEWFFAIGIPLMQGYGMSETTMTTTFCTPTSPIGSVGRAVDGVEVRIAADEEVLLRGGSNFDGYLGMADRTAETIDSEGWIHTGDIGVLDEDGNLSIVDRKKELIITAGGKNISPSHLEAALKQLPLVGHACAIGDDRPFVSALVVLDAELAPAWAANLGLATTDLATLAGLDEVRELIIAELPAAMAPFNNAERVKKITVIGDEWAADSDVLTPTMKLKRRGILARYSAEIEAMYA